jgi:hypothetical protein
MEQAMEWKREVHACMIRIPTHSKRLALTRVKKKKKEQLCPQTKQLCLPLQAGEKAARPPPLPPPRLHVVAELKKSSPSSLLCHTSVSVFIHSFSVRSFSSNTS